MKDIELRFDDDISLYPVHHFNKTIPKELSTVIQKATEKSATLRFPTASAMLEALDEINAPAAIPNVVYNTKSDKVRQLKRFVPIALIIILSLVGGLTAGLLLLEDKTSNPFEALNNEPLNHATAALPTVTEEEDEEEPVTPTEVETADSTISSTNLPQQPEPQPAQQQPESNTRQPATPAPIILRPLEAHLQPSVLHHTLYVLIVSHKAPSYRSMVMRWA